MSYAPAFQTAFPPAAQASMQIALNSSTQILDDACTKRGHVHIWNTSGLLQIERCEHYCQFCTGEKAHKRWSSAWFLRRHVRETHCPQFTNLEVGEGWSRCPDGNTRPTNKKVRAPGSNKKKAGTKSAVKVKTKEMVMNALNNGDLIMSGNELYLRTANGPVKVEQTPSPQLGQLPGSTPYTSYPSSTLQQGEYSQNQINSTTPSLSYSGDSSTISSDIESRTAGALLSYLDTPEQSANQFSYTNTTSTTPVESYKTDTLNYLGAQFDGANRYNLNAGLAAPGHSGFNNDLAATQLSHFGAGITGPFIYDYNGTATTQQRSNFNNIAGLNIDMSAHSYFNNAGVGAGISTSDHAMQADVSSGFVNPANLHLNGPTAPESAMTRSAVDYPLNSAAYLNSTNYDYDANTDLSLPSSAMFESEFNSFSESIITGWNDEEHIFD